MSVYKDCVTGELRSSWDSSILNYASVKEVVDIVEKMAYEGKSAFEIYNAVVELQNAVYEINEPAPGITMVHK